MSEVERDEQSSHGVTLPVEWHVPETMYNRYVDHMLVQPGKYEITLLFFELRIPPFMGPPEANRAYLLNQGPVRFECASKLTVAPQLIPEMIKALQIGLDNYNAAKAREEREVGE